MVTKAGNKVSTLTIESVRDVHSGTYTCVAQNKAGVARYSANLNVNGIFTHCTLTFELFTFLPPFFPQSIQFWDTRHSFNIIINNKKII